MKITSSMVIQACLQQDIASLYTYKNLGFDFNKIRDQDGDSLLHLAIFYDKYKSFLALIDLGINLHLISSFNQATPLNLAISLGETYYVKKLIEKGVDINFVDGDGWTPLNMALLYENEYPKIINLLLSMPSVDVNIPVNEIPPIYISDDLKNIEKIVKHPSFDPTYNLVLLDSTSQINLKNIIHANHSNIDQGIIDSYHQAKILGMKLDYDGCFNFKNLNDHQYSCFDFEGYSNEAGVKAFSNSYNYFLNHVISLTNIPSWSFEAFTIIQSSLNFAATVTDPDMYLSKIQSGDLVIIPSGWDEHSICFVIHNNKLYRCNRGDQSDGVHGIEEFIITKQEGLTHKLVQQMLEAKGEPDLFHKDVLDILGLQKIGEIENPEQTAGNCVWTSLEAALEASFVDLFMQNELDSPIAHYYGKQVFHLWEEYDQLMEIVNLIEHKDVLVKSEIYDDLLIKALQYNHQADNPFDVQKGSIILSQINEPIFNDAFKLEIGDKVNLFYPGYYNNISYISDYQPASYYDYAKSWVYYMSSKSKNEFNHAKEYYDFLVACDNFREKNELSVIDLRDVINDSAIQSLEYHLNPNNSPLSQIANNGTIPFEIQHLELWKTVPVVQELSSEVIFA